MGNYDQLVRQTQHNRMLRFKGTFESAHRQLGPWLTVGMVEATPRMSCNEYTTLFAEDATSVICHENDAKQFLLGLRVLDVSVCRLEV